MKQKRGLSWYLSLITKFVAGLALYLCAGMLITICDKVMTAGNIGLGYFVLILGLAFLAVQFYFGFKASGEIFAPKAGNLISKITKALSGMTLFASLGVLATYAEQMLNPGTIGQSVIFLGGMLVATQLAVMAYGIGHFVEGKVNSEVGAE